MPSKPCHLSPGRSTQQLGIGGEQLGRRLVEGDPLARLGVADFLGIPRREEPVLLGEELLADARDRQAAGHRLVDDLLGQRLPAGPSIMAAATSFEAISA